VCGINLGFRVTPTGLRVATIATESGTEFCHLPKKMDARDERCRSTSAATDLALQQLQVLLRAQLTELSVHFPEDIRIPLESFSRARTCHATQLTSIIVDWRKCPEIPPHVRLARSVT
jgi:hypothetical protein